MEQKISLRIEMSKGMSIGDQHISSPTVDHKTSNLWGKNLQYFGNSMFRDGDMDF